MEGIGDWGVEAENFFDRALMYGQFHTTFTHQLGRFKRERDGLAASFEGGEVSD